MDIRNVGSTAYIYERIPIFTEPLRKSEICFMQFYVQNIGIVSSAPADCY